MSETLRHRITTLETREKRYRKRVALQKAQIDGLKVALKAFLDSNELGYGSPISEDDSDDCGDHKTEVDRETTDGVLGTDEDEDDLPDAIWDDDSNVYLCSESECRAEVVEGACHRCGTEFKWSLDQERFDIRASTDNEAVNSDRCRVRRGTTPLLASEIALVRGYWPRRVEEYASLIERGATHLMCETFHLEFQPNTGIFAWADGDIYDAFAGPAMKQGDFWKIYLGRRIQLDDDDPDGAEFIEGLIEDALLFPVAQNSDNRRWTTVEEAPGIWVSRPIDLEAWQDDDDELQSGESSDEESVAYEFTDEAPVGLPEQTIIRSNEYELSDGDSDVEINDNEIDDELDENEPGWAIRAGIQDSAYEQAEQDETGDSSGNDFSSEEILSGDEAFFVEDRD